MNYLYASGRIAAINAKIFDASVLLKFAKPEGKLYANLKAAGYGASGATVTELVAEELEKTRKFLLTLAPGDENLALLLLENEAVNLKSLYKAKFYGADLAPLESAVLAPEVIETFIETGDVKRVPKAWRGLFAGLAGLTPDTPPQELSVAIDSAVYRYALKKAHYRPLRQYFIHKIDAANILAVIRMGRLEYAPEAMAKLLLTGGNFAQRALLAAGDEAGWRDLLDGTPFAFPVAKFYSHYSLERLDNDLRAGDIEYWHKYRYDAESFGPVAHYYLKKVIEGQNIKKLAAGEDDPNLLVVW